ncbi:MAG: 2-C-methyl-D-erythritol 2,4-cyclodiphosphate synthase [Oscillospiraceae bacterium]|nr:2-C-methyl-D-erythritol 2,4-cyclodiphosphate synthase [Oscillospiraceae bacterium]
MRIGHGYDVHRLVEGRELILGGVTIEYNKGLLGHSDADVLVHAIMDALLGAAGLGDIGQHFPASDDKFKGISSLKLLERVNTLLKAQNFHIVNIDSTVILEEPKISKYIQSMKHNISSTLQCDVNLINIKATTEEGLGFTGIREGIAAHAVVLIKKGEQ